MFCGGLGSFGGYGYGPLGGAGFRWMFPMMGLSILLFIGIIVFAVKPLKVHRNKSVDAISILNEKFANGEISEEEYVKRRSLLSQKN